MLSVQWRLNEIITLLVHQDNKMADNLTMPLKIVGAARQTRYVKPMPI